MTILTTRYQMSQSLYHCSYNTCQNYRLDLGSSSIIIMSIITISCMGVRMHIIQIQLIPNFPSQTKEVCIFFLNIIHMTINEPDSNINDYYLLSSLYRVLICVTCREIFRTLLTQERLFELLTAVYIVYIITILQSLRT